MRMSGCGGRVVLSISNCNPVSILLKKDMTSKLKSCPQNHPEVFGVVDKVVEVLYVV
jgi:hypothetical protein